MSKNDMEDDGGIISIYLPPRYSGTVTANNYNNQKTLKIVIKDSKIESISIPIEDFLDIKNEN